MGSMTSTHSSIPSPTSVDTEDRELSSVPQQDAVDDKEASLSAPPSPGGGRQSLHRRQRSQSLDAIDVPTLELTSSQPSIKIDALSPEDREVSPGFDITDGGLDSSDSDSDIDDLDLQVDKHRVAASLQGSVPPSEPTGDLKESEEEGGRLTQIKGMFLSKMRSSKNNLMPRPHSQSPQAVEAPGTETKDVASSLPADVEGDGRSSGGSQWMGAMKQRLRVNSPGLWRKMRRISPSNQAVPTSEDLDLAKLEEARRKCKSRIIAI